MLGALTLDQLRVLVAIADSGSFSAAGRKLMRAQSAVSHAVQALERSQQVALFDRGGRRPHLTPAGAALVLQARQVLRQADLFERTAAGIAGGLEPELTLAVDALVATHPIIETLGGLMRQFPDLVVNYRTEAIWGGEQRVRRAEATLAICTLRPVEVQDLHATRLTHLELVPVVAPSHPLAIEKGPIARDKLAAHVQLILTNPDDASGISYSVVSPRIWRFVDLARRLEFLLAGLGWGTMPRHSVAEHLRAGDLVALPIDDPSIVPEPIPIYAAFHRDRPLGPAGAWLLDNLQRQRWP
ncbi:MAG: LysR family transcriptional regulator [Sphingopyxis sp.]|nr:LysR family transcriptional regulator [Sphingopyxis sp.]